MSSSPTTPSDNKEVSENGFGFYTRKKDLKDASHL